MFYARVFIGLLLASLFCTLSARAQVVKYPDITARKTGPANPLSPDPLVNYSWDDPKALDGLQSYCLRPVSWAVTEKDSFDLRNFKNNNVIVVNGSGSIRFDFARTNAAWLEFDSEDVTDEITMGISEYNEPAIVNEGSVNPVKIKKPVKYGHTYRLELNPELYEGVRFGWINVNKHIKPWHLKNLRLVCQIKPVNYQGSFSCSDPQLTRIWYTGAYTVKLNLQKDYFGAILMERSDRHSWTGDAYPSQAASMVAFGNYDFVKANLINTSGLNNDIASYSLYWVLSHIDYVNYSGDTEFGIRYIDAACKKLDIAWQQYGHKPRLGFYGWDERLGAGGEDPDIPETQHAYSMLSIRTWFEFGRLMQQLGKTDIAGKYITYAQLRINEERNKNIWLSEFGLHASADAINTGLTDNREDSVFYARNYKSRVNRLSYSPFNEYFIITALAKMQKYDDALSSIEDCWGGQLQYGGTTFFEVFRPSWNNILNTNDAPPNNQCGYTSLTHPWSSGVTKWLSEEVLGIKPLRPGFKLFEIQPHLGAKLTSVKGATPTFNGAITVDFNLRTGINKIGIPVGTKAERVDIPLAGDVSSVFVNGKLIWAMGSRQPKNMRLQKDYLSLHDLLAGKYTFQIEYNSFNHKRIIKNPTWEYAINKFDQDSSTGGQWKNNYGKEGYYLFNYFGNGNHLQKLPSYISSVVLKKEANVHMVVPITDKKILTDTAGHDHVLGAIITQDPKPCLQTMTLDINTTDTGQHQAAIYFLDWDNKDRRSAIEIFDLKTLNLLSPVQLIKNYQKGKYLIFTYSGNIRIRINQVRGENAAISGLFFK